MNEFPTPRAMSKEIFGEAYVREFDLTIAANVLESFRTGKTLYNRDINARVASRCMPLDQALSKEFLGVIHVPPNEESPWRRDEDVLRERLVGKPRGNWAILECDGRYDAFISDGVGGIGTESGHKFAYSSAASPNLTDYEALYGTILSYSIYVRRQEIEATIVKHSVERAMPAVRATVKDQYLAGKRFNKVVVEEIVRAGDGSFDHAIVEATRRGVPRQRFKIHAQAVASMFAVPYTMPPEFEDAGNAARLRSLTERRYEAGQKAWTELPRHERPVGISTYESAARFRNVDDDTLVRSLWGHPEERRPGQDGRIGEFKVTFEPGTDRLVSAEAYLFEDRPSPAP